MMTAKLSDGREVRILFKHQRFEQPQFHIRQGRGRHAGEEVWVQAQTLCRIVEGPREQEQELLIGSALCSVHDNFCREEGRQMALAHALGLSPHYHPLNPKGQKNLRVAPVDAATLLQAYQKRPRRKAAAPKKTGD